MLIYTLKCQMPVYHFQESLQVLHVSDPNWAPKIIGANGFQRLGAQFELEVT